MSDPTERATEWAMLLAREIVEGRAVVDGASTEALVEAVASALLAANEEGRLEERARAQAEMRALLWPHTSSVGTGRLTLGE